MDMNDGSHIKCDRCSREADFFQNLLLMDLRRRLVPICTTCHYISDSWNSDDRVERSPETERQYLTQEVLDQ